MPPRLVMPAWAHAAAVPVLGGLRVQRQRGLARGGEQPCPGLPAQAPQVAQQLEHVAGQGHVAVLGALALLDADAHAVGRAVDVLGLQVAQLGQPQPRAVGQLQEGARLEVRAHGKQPREFVAREDFGRPLRRARQRDLERRAVVSEHGGVEKPERAAILVERRARQMALAPQVQQAALHFSSALSASGERR